MAGETDTHTDTHHVESTEAGDGHGHGHDNGHNEHGMSEHIGAGAASELHTGTEAHGGGHHDVGFPPFDSSTFAPQLIWLTLSFTVLYLLMSRVVLPRIGDIIEDRSDRIARDLGTAERLKTETEKALGAYEQALADARGNASEIAKQTREKLASEVEVERKRVDTKINSQVADAEARIGQTRQKALASVNEIAGDVAATLVSKLIGGSVSADEARAALAKTSAKS